MSRRTVGLVVSWAVIGFCAARLYGVTKRRYPLGDTTPQPVDVIIALSQNHKNRPRRDA